MGQRAATGKIRIGPAGWSYSDWAGIVYPRPRPRGFHEAEYLAHFFDTIEINSSFYRPPAPQVVRGWIRHVSHNPRFQFTAKLWKQFTHERKATHEGEKLVKEGLAPIAQEGRLGAVLMQFPWSFRNNQENREYVGALAMMFMEYPLVLEVRHGSWSHPDTFRMLADLGVAFCNIDQPLIGPSIAPSARATSLVGYVRLHGRNYENWFSNEGHPEERYNYLYTAEELEPWAARIRSIAESTDTTFVITNNHFEGMAIANGMQLTHLVTGKPVQIPEIMLASYPELGKISGTVEREQAPPFTQVQLRFDTPDQPNKKI